MSKHKKSKLSILSLLQNVYRSIRKMIQRLMRSLLRTWIRMNRRDRYGRAGFVLPTVTMVIMVVVLLSLAITFRAFDRAKDAQYTRVSQQTLNAVAPAIDRAKAKVTQALQEVTEISDEEIYKILTTNRFKFGDEEVVQVQYNIDEQGGIDPEGKTEKINDNERVETAWRFPFDTDNNGKYDSYILYGIFSTTPAQGKPRNPLNARTQPLPSLEVDPECAFVSGGVDDLVTEEGLTPTRGRFKKSIFAYATTVPITSEMAQGLGNEYEASLQENSPAASPLEYQQDWQIKPLNGVVYRDDLEINPGPAFNFNGSLLTQSNLIISPFNNNITLYQVSAKESCFYDADLSKITVGGNVINGMVDQDRQSPVQVHLFQPDKNNDSKKEDPKIAEISTKNQSVQLPARQAMYNDTPYRARLESLVQEQLKAGKNSDPVEVQALVNRRVNEEGDTEEKARRDELERYFKQRLRKIPQAEGAVATDAAGSNPLDKVKEWGELTMNAPLQITNTQLEATQPNEDTRKTGIEDRLGDRVLVGNNQPALEPASEQGENDVWVPAKLEKGEAGTWTSSEEEEEDNRRERPTQAEELPAAGDLSRDGFWEKAAARLPKSFIEGVGGLRVVTGGGVYERESSFLPPPLVKDPDPASTTGAIDTYDDPATGADEEFPVVWPDTMPMSPVDGSIVFDNDPSTRAWDSTPVSLSSLSPSTGINPSSIDPNTPKYAKGDLKMRATAVYHYAQDAFDPPDDLDQKPIACISSYYDPSTNITAKNAPSLGWEEDPEGRSNNGIVYGPPQTARPGQSNLGAYGLLTGGNADLDKQANFVFPDGRFANKPLRDALLKAPGDRSLAENAAIDATLCALDILSGSVTRSNNVIPDGAIFERTLLNAREVKAIHKDNLNTDVDETFTLSSPLPPDTQAANVDETKYDLPLEDRQPLEIRVTQIDLHELRNREIANTTANIDELDPEYMLPYSGIIYATRDDALPDRSYREGDDNTGVDEDLSKALSPVDFVLDPTRRPNGIMLIHGGSLGRNDSASPQTEQDVLKEKGLTLVSNLPVYIKADDRDQVASDSGNIDARGSFNKHTQEEFEQPFDWAFDKFYNNRKDLNLNFACRKDDPIREDLGKACREGDNWRPVTVFADAITLLSDEYREGFRNEGDFDLRNNAGNAVVGYDFDASASIDSTDPTVNEANFGIDLNGNNTRNDTGVKETEVTAKAARQLNGFNAYNDFAVNGLSVNVDLDGTDRTTGNDYTRAYTDELYRSNNNNALNSSYFNNFVTPIQRRGNRNNQFSEYVMEMCLKPFVSACGPDDWVVDTASTPNKARSTIGNAITTFESGTTATPPPPLTATSPDMAFQRYPRRVAFLRNANNQLILDNDGRPIPLGIDGNGDVQCYSTSGTNFDGETCLTGLPRKQNNALWFQTRNVTNKNWGSSYGLWYYDPQNPNTSLTFPTATVQQPLLVPVLQIHASDNQPKANEGSFPVSNNQAQANTRWISKPSRDGEFNLVFGAGDVPSRPGETNGGLQNLARFLEDWQQVKTGGTTQRTTTIAGSFVQSGRSEYATAPYFGLRGDGEIFGETKRKYNIGTGSGQIPYFAPPNRSWGFDVGLYYQPPDYFSRKFARLDKDVEGKVIVQQYFRELPQDDPWVKGLLCAKVKNNGENAIPDRIRGSIDCEDYGG
ncbi:MAG: hormogonium polysaccharide biosynthesis protein HpsA [Lyngbya sp.]|nr:hormogonium polysaccharide biosynthesis protein HpsA [Lyngbya sp.]